MRKPIFCISDSKAAESHFFLNLGSEVQTKSIFDDT